MSSAEERDRAEISSPVKILHVAELPAEHRGLHHLVDQPGRLGRGDDQLEILQRGGHRYGTRDMQTLLQTAERERGMGRNRRQQVHGVDPLGRQRVVHAAVTIVQGVRPGDGAAARRIRVDEDHIADLGMRQIQRHEVRPEAEPDHGHPQALRVRARPSSPAQCHPRRPVRRYCSL